ncbi:MAG TPA: hypothetical protein ENO03_06995 [Candidatus Aminicenantes bacterium]|nr:hypothetical protein [Candidatus Aminicenantes bacterium]HDT14087.1 hypothetical protein [Candidatus Aminicenantes bacterium]
MGSIRPAAPGRLLLAGTLLVGTWLAACVRKPPVLIPPAGGVEAVEGFGSAAIAGAEASIKGKFGFVFRRPDLGRIEAVDPIGRTSFLILCRDGRAWFVLPRRKVYAEDEAAAVMERVLGLALLPDEAIRLLSGTWGPGSDGEEGGWQVEADERGRTVRGVHGDFAFTVRRHFPGAGVPREIGVEGPGASGRVKVLKLGFNPPPRTGIFDVSFLRAYGLKTWDELLELLDR